MLENENEQQKAQIILESWVANAKPWTEAVRNHEIASRKLVTNQAIVEQVLKAGVTSVWDVGCGEGWLSRQLQQHGFTCFGTDAIQSLVDAATASGLRHTACLSYSEIIAGSFSLPFTPRLAVFNFSLFEEESTAPLLRAIGRCLTEPKRLIIQTVHPFTASPPVYKPQWLEGNWQGFSESFTKPFPWYFRTVSDWLLLLHSCGFSLEEMAEPLHPETGKPASLIIRARLA